jgi:hypothetical protein
MVSTAPSARPASAILTAGRCNFNCPPGTGFCAPETPASEWPLSSRTRVSETAAETKGTAIWAVIRASSGTRRKRQTAWWRREDSNFRPDHYLNISDADPHQEPLTTPAPARGSYLAGCLPFLEAVEAHCASTDGTRANVDGARTASLDNADGTRTTSGGATVYSGPSSTFRRLTVWEAQSEAWSTQIRRLGPRSGPSAK